MTDCCTSHIKKFQVPNGKDILDNDTRTTVTLPEGIISNEGLQAIAKHLSLQGMYYINYVGQHVADGVLGDQWMTDRGTFPKRLKQYAHKNYGLSLGKTLLEEVGNIARANSVGAEVRVAVTRDLNLSAASFAHGGSCWWSADYRRSRCAFKTNGGFGVRAYGPGEVRPRVTGRVWVFPVSKQGQPTFDTLSAAGFVVFNGYGSLSNLTGVRVMSSMVGMPYHRVRFNPSIKGDDEAMQVNNYTGYLLTGDPDLVDFDLDWLLSHHAAAPTAVDLVTQGAA